MFPPKPDRILALLISENVISVFFSPAGALQLNQESEAAVDAVSNFDWLM